MYGGPPSSDSVLTRYSSPPKIKAVRIIDNPFPDIIPRITAAERRAQQKAREQAQREREEVERRKGAKKCDTCFSLPFTFKHRFWFIGTQNFLVLVLRRRQKSSRLRLKRNHCFDLTVCCIR